MSVGLIPPVNAAAVGGFPLIGVYTGSAAASIDCISRNQGSYAGNLFQTDFDSYLIRCVGMIPTTTLGIPRLRFSTNSGVSWDTANNYGSASFGYSNTGSGSSGSQAQSYFGPIGAINTGVAGEGNASATIFLDLSYSLGNYPRFHALTSHKFDNGFPAEGQIATGIYYSLTQVTSLQVSSSLGNISGNVLVYGIPKTASTGNNNVLSGTVVQKVSTQTATSATGTTVIPFDNTIPQNTEGDQYMTLAITPKSATNKLQIEVLAFATNSAAAAWITAALFQDAIANALATNAVLSTTSTAGGFVKLTYTMVAGTTSATTFKVRMGGSAAGTTTFNGQGGAGLFGGTLFSSIVIEEIAV